MLIRLSITSFNTLHKNKSSKYRQISIHSTLISWLIFCMSVTLLVFATDCLWFLRILTYHLLTVWKFRKTLTIISLQNFREIDVLSSKINDTLAIFTKHFPSESNFMILNIVLLKSTWNSNPQREKICRTIVLRSRKPQIFLLIELNFFKEYFIGYSCT